MESEVFCRSECMRSTIIRTSRNKIVTMSQFASTIKLKMVKACDKSLYKKAVSGMA